MQRERRVSDFVTVPEAAKRLGLNEMRVRQSIDVLPEHNKRLSAMGVQEVRLSAVAESLGLVVPSDERTETPGNNGRKQSMTLQIEGILCVAFCSLGAG